MSVFNACVNMRLAEIWFHINNRNGAAAGDASLQQIHECDARSLTSETGDFPHSISNVTRTGFNRAIYR